MENADNQSTEQDQVEAKHNPAAIPADEVFPARSNPDVADDGTEGDSVQDEASAEAASERDVEDQNEDQAPEL